MGRKEEFTGTWLDYYEALLEFTTEFVVSKYISDFKELWEFGRPPKKAFLIVKKIDESRWRK